MLVCYKPGSPEPLVMSVARRSDIGLVWGFTMSSQNRAAILLNEDDMVLQIRTLNFKLKTA